MSTARGTAPIADVVAVLIFTLLGRRAHDRAEVLLGLLGTAWPFLTGLAVGWVALLVLRLDPLRRTAGALLAVTTVALGMTLRHLAGGGVQPSFVLVATTFLGLFLIGWRALAVLVARRRPSTR